jgi:histamine receptor H3
MAPFTASSFSLGRTACTIWLILDYVVCSTSVLCMVVISYDRYLLVTKGVKYLTNQKPHKTVLIMASVWLLAFLNHAPAIIIWETIRDNESSEETACQTSFTESTGYLIVNGTFEFILPLICIISFNTGVYINIRKRSQGFFI